MFEDRVPRAGQTRVTTKVTEVAMTTGTVTKDAGILMTTATVTMTGTVAVAEIAVEMAGDQNLIETLTMTGIAVVPGTTIGKGSMETATGTMVGEMRIDTGECSMCLTTHHTRSLLLLAKLIGWNAMGTIKGSMYHCMKHGLKAEKVVLCMLYFILHTFTLYLYLVHFYDGRDTSFDGMRHEVHRTG